MTTKDNVLKWSMIVGSVLWIAIAGSFHWEAFIGPQSYEKSSVSDKIDNCEGSFKQRYECKSSLIINDSRETFMDWTWRLAVVFGPPLALGIAWQMHPEPKRRRHEKRQHRRNRSQGDHSGDDHEHPPGHGHSP